MLYYVYSSMHIYMIVFVLPVKCLLRADVYIHNHTCCLVVSMMLCCHPNKWSSPPN